MLQWRFVQKAHLIDAFAWHPQHSTYQHFLIDAKGIHEYSAVCVRYIYEMHCCAVLTCVWMKYRYGTLYTTLKQRRVHVAGASGEAINCGGWRSSCELNNWISTSRTGKSDSGCALGNQKNRECSRDKTENRWRHWMVLLVSIWHSLERQVHSWRMSRCYHIFFKGDIVAVRLSRLDAGCSNHVNVTPVSKSFMAFVLQMYMLLGHGVECLQLPGYTPSSPC